MKNEVKKEKKMGLTNRERVMLMANGIVILALIANNRLTTRTLNKTTKSLTDATAEVITTKMALYEATSMYNSLIADILSRDKVQVVRDTASRKFTLKSL